MSAAGLSVDLHTSGTPHGLPPGLDLAAYRIVQEGLTNVINHAGQAPATVRLEYRRQELVITVTDDGGGTGGSGLGGAGTNGRGLLGLRERLAVYGGDLSADPARRRLAAARPHPALRVRRQRTGRPGQRRARGYGIGMQPDAAPRVLVADDQTLVRSGFRLILGSAGIPVVAEAADGLAAVAATLKHRPDVVLMDIRMPEMDGLEATGRILASRSDVRIIMLTTFDLDQYVYAALSAGASGFLLKDVSLEHLIAAVRLVRCGDALLAPSITRRLVERFAPREVSGSARGRANGDLSALTPRELEVLGLIARGLSNAELAATLTLSEATVKTHVARILAKLQLRDRVQAVVLAYEIGLVSPGADVREG